MDPNEPVRCHYCHENIGTAFLFSRIETMPPGMMTCMGPTSNPNRYWDAVPCHVACWEFNVFELAKLHDVMEMPK